MSRDTLFLLEPGFEDPNYPGERFVCPHGIQIEGLLAGFPDLARQLDIERVSFARPRQRVVERLGEKNQSLPVLIFGDDPAPADAERHEGTAFVTASKRILDLLAERHGFPRLHP